MKQLFLVLILLAGAGGAYWMLNQDDQGEPGAQARGGFRGGAVPVVVDTVSVMEFKDRVEAIGTTRANESVVITAKVTDKISNIEFQDGQTVEKGELLVELTNDEQTAQLAEAKADVKEARSQLDRVEGLVSKGTIAASQVDEIRARYGVTNARLEGIMARLKDRVVRAPFSGVLGFRQVSPGTLVTPGTAITTLDDVSTLKLDFSVPEMFLGAVDIGDVVLAASPAYREKGFEGTVTGIGSRIDEVTRTATVRAFLPNKTGELRPGMLMTVELQTSAKSALSVKESAVIPAGNQANVYVVGADNKVERRSVVTGQRADGRIEVVSGLSEGERVVTLGLLRLRPGSTVKITEPGEG
ncbi:MAG: efflux RND transporter periplasmic adaptor subunit [Gammaproteobacteria bacterium]